jgi:uncharacterized membrane protein YhhN
LLGSCHSAVTALSPSSDGIGSHVQPRSMVRAKPRNPFAITLPSLRCAADNMVSPKDCSHTLANRPSSAGATMPHEVNPAATTPSSSAKGTRPYWDSKCAHEGAAINNMSHRSTGVGKDMPASVASSSMPVLPAEMAHSQWLWWCMAAAIATMVVLELWAPQGPRWRYGLAKMAGTATFLLAAVVHRPSWPVIVGLFCCAVGDVLLIPKGAKRLFVAGLAAFLVGHLAFAAAFAPPPSMAMLMTAAPILVVGVGIYRWLSPHVPARMGKPVNAYIIAILAMAWMALTAAWHGSLAWTVGVGAMLFCASDVFVARERFVSPSKVNRVVGIPLYFFAQLLLARG